MKSRMMWAVALMFLGASLVAPVASRAADSGSWTAVAPPTAARAEAVAITLASGKVLVAGGSRSGPVTLTSAEIYDPATDTWAPAAPLGTARVGATGVRLHSGKVLVIGGSSSAGTPLDTAEVYDPTTNMWQNVTNAMGSPRAGGPMAQLLPDGRVLIAGGTDALDNPVATADLYDPTTNAFTPAHAMGSARAGGGLGAAAGRQGTRRRRRVDGSRCAAEHCRGL